MYKSFRDTGGSDLGSGESWKILERVTPFLLLIMTYKNLLYTVFTRIMIFAAQDSHLKMLAVEPCSSCPKDITECLVIDKNYIVRNLIYVLVLRLHSR